MSLKGLRLTRRDDITCRELVELVTEYLEGTLDRADRKRFEAHIALCDGCDAYIDQVRQMVAAFGRFDERSLDPRAREELMSAFRGWKRERAPAES